MDKDEHEYEFEIRNYLSNLCFLLWKKDTANKNVVLSLANQDTAWLHGRLNYINAHFMENISLNQAATSQREVLRCFKRMTQISPIQYVLNYWAQYGVKSFFETSLLSISKIATVLGLNSPSYFST